MAIKERGREETEDEGFTHCNFLLAAVFDPKERKRTTLKSPELQNENRWGQGLENKLSRKSVLQGGGDEELLVPWSLCVKGSLIWVWERCTLALELVARAENILARGFALVKGGAPRFRPGFRSRVCDHLAGCPFTEHTWNDDSPRARLYSGRWRKQPCHLRRVTLTPGNVNFFIGSTAGLDGYRVAVIPSSCQIWQGREWVCPPLTDEPPALGGGRGEGPDRPFCFGHF